MAQREEWPFQDRTELKATTLIHPELQLALKSVLLSSGELFVEIHVQNFMGEWEKVLNKSIPEGHLKFSFCDWFNWTQLQACGKETGTEIRFKLPYVQTCQGFTHVAFYFFQVRDRTWTVCMSWLVGSTVSSHNKFIAGRNLKDWELGTATEQDQDFAVSLWDGFPFKGNFGKFI